MAFTRAQLFGLFLGPLAFVAILLAPASEGLDPPARAVLAATIWIAVWWVLEAIPIAATGFLPLILFPLTGAVALDVTAAAYAHYLVFLALAGFMIAVTLERWNLHRRIALGIIRLVGTDLRLIILGFMLATAFLSMWISNTATSVMMLPVALAVARQLGPGLAASGQGEGFGRALMLSIAYACSIGGMGTLIGTTTNAMMAGVIDELYGVSISFVDWMVFGLPVAGLLLAIAWYYLTTVAFRLPRGLAVAGGRAEIERQYRALGPISVAEQRTAAVFFAVAAAWISRSFLFPDVNDAVIGLIGVLVLFVLPSAPPLPAPTPANTQGNSDPEGYIHDRANANQPEGHRLLDWRTAEGIPWGILILFGGGLAIATGFKETGLAAWIGTQLTSLQFLPYFFIVLVIIAAVNFLTEITSNVATAAMLLPILAALAATLGVHPYGLMVAATLAASCAFMLPVATPPNAVVFGSGYLTIPGMVRVGIWLNLISIVVLTLVIYLLLPLAWGIDLNVFPADWSVTG